MAGSEVLGEIVRSLRRESRGSGASEGLVVRCMRTPEGLGDPVQAGLSFQADTVTLGRRQHADRVVRHGHSGCVVVQVELNSVLSVQCQLGRKRLALEGVLGRNGVRVVGRSIREANVESGLDGAAGRHVICLAGHSEHAGEAGRRRRDAGARVERTAVRSAGEVPAGETTGDRAAVLAVESGAVTDFPAVLGVVAADWTCAATTASARRVAASAASTTSTTAASIAAAAGTTSRAGGTGSSGGLTTGGVGGRSIGAAVATPSSAGTTGFSEEIADVGRAAAKQ